MKFSEFEKLMNSNGITSLAEIARLLNTTPQAVSNWKARNQIPNHIVLKINSSTTNFINIENNDEMKLSGYPQSNFSQSLLNDINSVSLSDILLIIAQQLKLILLTSFVTVFLTFTFVKFIQKPTYESKSTILLPINKTQLSGLAGLANQFGVNLPQNAQADLSSPSLFPELIKSRTFVERVLNKKFYKKEIGDSLSLLAILTHGDEKPIFSKDTLIHQAYYEFDMMVNFNTQGSFSVLTVTSEDPIFARDLNALVLVELKSLNRFFKTQAVKEKISFIENRISSVIKDLQNSEQDLKTFNEQNRQINSPSLQLELDRFTREVEIQKGIFLTLKQQYELAKIEEIQGSSAIRILDEPQIPFGASNKNIKLSVFLSVFVGLGLGLIFAFIRSYLDNDNINERRKLKKVKNYVKKKSKGVFLDYRISGIVSILMLLGLPYYLTYRSPVNPVYFGMYSKNMMIIIITYSIILVSSSLLFIYATMKKK